MKKPLFLILLCSLATFTNAQYTYIEDPALFEENKLPARSSFIFDTQEQLRPIANNPNYLLLNGDWLFQHSNTPEERPLGFYENDFNTDAWATIPVPGDWQMYGYDYPIYTNWKYPFKPDKPNVPRDFNPVGSYKKTFVLPKGWDNELISLHFGGVNSCFFVWVNGEYVGYSEDSKLPSEFTINNELKEGENQIAVEVYKYCDGTYLEDQDMWRLSGIERDVYLYKNPEEWIWDYTIEASLSDDLSKGDLEIKMDYDLWLKNENYLEVNLLNDQGEIVWQRKNINRQGNVTFQGEINDVKSWSAEEPYLYTLSIMIKNKQNEIIQKIEQKVGFRSLKIENGIFYINGDTALIKGVNRHEHDPYWGHAVGYTGNVVNEDSLRKDLELIKSLNFNAVRTAHYPNHPLFYDLCDEIGLYVCDEANIEGHWYMMFKPFDNLAIDPDFNKAILSRIYNMYQRDKNHPCVIIWSVGNETGTGKTMVQAYKMLKHLDPNRPVFNERHFFLNTIKEKHSDFNGNMYAPIHKVSKIIKKDKEKPFIWIEYAHAMGNSTGNFKDLWGFVRANPQVQGGFVWDWRDQGIWKTNENGEKFLAYGGHFEPKDSKFTGGLQGDGNFCANGVIAADGKLHPGADAIKNAQSNIQIEMLTDNSYRFINEFESLNLKDFNCRINWKTSDCQEYFDELNDLTCKPLSDTIIYFGQEEDIAVIVFSVSKDDFEYKKNFFLKEMNAPKVKLSTKTTRFSVDEMETNIDIWNENLIVLLTKEGYLRHLIVDNQMIFIEGPKVNFWRAPTDNDFGNGAQKRLTYWKTAVEESELVLLNHSQVDNYYAIETTFKLPENKGTYSVNYQIYEDGIIQVDLFFDLKNADEIPRIGTYMVIPESYALVNYYGLGPNENYIDRQQGQWFFEHSFALNESAAGSYRSFPLQKMPYIRPQEYGNRTKTYSIDLLAPFDTISITGNNLSFSAWTHSMDDIDEGKQKQGKTALDIPNRDFIWLNIDHAQMGVGGDNSWGRKPYEQYLLKAGEYSYSYTISPR